MRILGLIILWLLSAQICFADIYVVYDKDTSEVYTISEKNDTILPQGKEIKTLKGKLSDYDWQYNPVYYKLKGDKFIVNTKKINDDEQEAIKQTEIKEEIEKVKSKMADESIAKLENEGVVLKHKAEVKEALKKATARND